MIALLLARFGLPWFAMVIGPVVLFLPGLNLALILEQLAFRRESAPTLLLWSWVFTLTITPFVIFVLGTYLQGETAALNILPGFGLWWLVSSVLAVGMSMVRGMQSGIMTASWLPADRWEGIVTAAAALGILATSFLLYPFMPEADGYTYLILLDRASTDVNVLLGDSRLFFLFLINVMRELLSLDPYWVLKVVFPLGILWSVAVILLLSRQELSARWLRGLVALSPLFFPITLQETLITRPQSVFFLTILPVLYLVGEGLALRRGVSQIYWLAALFMASIVGLRIHTLFTLFLPLFGLGMVGAFWPVIRRYPIESVVGSLTLAILGWPWLGATRLLADTSRLIEILVQSIANNQFVFWFIDHYRNVDGVELGWPGLSALYYYGYNLGLFFPVLLVLVCITSTRGLRSKLVASRYWPVWLVFGFFFSVAEVLPHFELAYLPDRAWLFVALILTMFIPAIVRAVTERRSSLVLSALLIAAALSVGIGAALTYAKQGWISVAEAKARNFILSETPANAVFLGQGGHHVLVRYMGHRTLIRPSEDVFLSENVAALEAYLNTQSVAVNQETGIQAEQQRLAILEALRNLEDVYRTDAVTFNRDALARELRALASQAEVEPVESGADERQRIPANTPVYVIYSRDKFSSIYGTRGWYRASNFYGAKLDKFSEHYPVVYDAGGTTIWKVRD